MLTELLCISQLTYAIMHIPIWHMLLLCSIDPCCNIISDGILAKKQLPAQLRVMYLPLYTSLIASLCTC